MDGSVTIAGFTISWQILTMFIFAAVVAVVLFVFMAKTRTGMSMRATVDGLVLQAALRPKGFDLERSFSVLGFFLKRSLGAFLDSLDDGDGPSPS